MQSKDEETLKAANSTIEDLKPKEENIYFVRTIPLLF